MGKKLSEMSLEELWQLFPVFLKEHQACWEEWYFEEEAFVQKYTGKAKGLYAGRY